MIFFSNILNAALLKMINDCLLNFFVIFLSDFLLLLFFLGWREKKKNVKCVDGRNNSFNFEMR